MKRTCTPEVCVRSRRRREVEGVVHRARRMVRREVQRLEVVEVVLDLRAVGELVAQAREDVGDALERLRDRMLRAQARPRPGRLTSMRSVARRSASASSSSACLRAAMRRRPRPWRR
jgi:hypothetical protein